MANQLFDALIISAYAADDGDHPGYGADERLYSLALPQVRLAEVTEARSAAEIELNATGGRRRQSLDLESLRTALTAARATGVATQVSGRGELTPRAACERTRGGSFVVCPTYHELAHPPRPCSPRQLSLMTSTAVNPSHSCLIWACPFHFTILSHIWQLVTTAEETWQRISDGRVAALA